jgi:ATPase subunit of ABC transporter with duplicated ATPase domains
MQVLVSHDFRLISQVAHEIYEVNKVGSLMPVAGRPMPCSPSSML